MDDVKFLNDKIQTSDPENYLLFLEALSIDLSIVLRILDNELVYVDVKEQSPMEKTPLLLLLMAN